MPQHNERAQFIEETGLLFEKMGVTRMAGRILGYLMVSDKDMVSFDELTRVLQASKSSISTNIKMLVQFQFVKPATIPGDRKTYYMLSPDLDWNDYIIKRVEALKELTALFKKGLELRSSKKDYPAHWLTDATDFYEWLIREFSVLIEEHKKATGENTG